MRGLAALLLLLCALPLRAEEVVLGLSQNRVSITTNFDGSEILIFGAVKRETALPEDPLQVVITVAGPSQQLTIRRKDRRFGIWVNSAAVPIDSAPSFYAVATSAPLRQTLSETEDLRHSVTVPRAIRSVGAPADVGDAQLFTDALIRIREKADLYQTLEGEINFREQTLFSSAIALPANLTEGNYTTRIFLTRDGAVVSQYETVIHVNKVGLERFLFNLSREQPLVYGLLSLAIAIIAGWLASAAFTLLRQG
ncbi:TIGR02186 family protein [Lacimonas salitolerans]|uniref:TIGR02186 family protein n=1 Tax=Lacimonas salitolerans TaxID=1323750 RepID=A0ABW4EFW1_9RHOB